ncbi:MAG: hypothetical protein PHI12_11150, partial [Dehalococcoidales bacterium]|nr:hypothetical protein [Dehalococcoidales bacterium]
MKFLEENRAWLVEDEDWHEAEGTLLSSDHTMMFWVGDKLDRFLNTMTTPAATWKCFRLDGPSSVAEWQRMPEMFFYKNQMVDKEKIIKMVKVVNRGAFSAKMLNSTVLAMTGEPKPCLVYVPYKDGYVKFVVAPLLVEGEEIEGVDLAKEFVLQMPSMEEILLEAGWTRISEDLEITATVAERGEPVETTINLKDSFSNPERTVVWVSLESEPTDVKAPVTTRVPLDYLGYQIGMKMTKKEWMETDSIIVRNTAIDPDYIVELVSILNHTFTAKRMAEVVIRAHREESLFLYITIPKTIYEEEEKTASFIVAPRYPEPEEGIEKRVYEIQVGLRPLDKSISDRLKRAAGIKIEGEEEKPPPVVKKVVPPGKGRRMVETKRDTFRFFDDEEEVGVIVRGTEIGRRVDFYIGIMEGETAYMEWMLGEIIRVAGERGFGSVLMATDDETKQALLEKTGFKKVGAIKLGPVYRYEIPPEKPKEPEKPPPKPPPKPPKVKPPEEPP